MNNEKIFQAALQLSPPWCVTKTWFEQDKGKIIAFHIEIGYDKTYEFTPNGKVHDTKEKVWRHLNIFEHKCYVHCKVPRIKDQNGQVRMVQVPWARSGSGFTLLFEAFLIALVEGEMPVIRAAALLKEYPQRLWNIIKYWVRIAFQKKDLSDLQQIGIDETSTKKGHQYVTVVADIQKRRVIFATPGKDAQTVDRLKEHLKNKGVEADQISDISMDMSPAFISGIMKNFSNTRITFDKFHVVKLLNEALDAYRKLELREHESLRWHKYTLLKSEKKLSSAQKRERESLLTLLPRVGEAYRLKLLFNDFWDFKEKEQAGGFLMYWCDLAESHGSIVFRKLAQTIKGHWSGILNYVESQIANGILEGINNKIQLAKRRARGYQNIDNFINMIYLIAGDLEFDFPHNFI